jgi:signal transduction histidine kinase/DNA-binding response OmpR family regulator
MIRNLKDTTQKNTEQDWLKTNLAKFSRMLQGQKNLDTVGGLILSELAPVVAAQVARFYVLDTTLDVPQLRLLASYGADGRRAHGQRLDVGQGLVGQCALEKRKNLVTNVPSGYIDVASGLGAAAPRNILVLPVVFEGQVKGVLELGSFERFPDTHQAFLEQLMESVGIVINTIEANMRTEDLLTQSQSLAKELGSRQEELQTTNSELQEKARLLAHQNEEVERKNREVEQARQDLEEKARQLALTSKYKSEFLANMSHELRTPLNSLLILSDQLCTNATGNLTGKQVEFAKTIHSSGNDLLTLINDILDLSKIESGTVAVDVGELRLDDLRRYVERTFRHVAESKKLDFFIRTDTGLPAAMATDAKRLQQIIKNLLSNAFKFTHRGQVALSIESVSTGWDPANEDLNRAPGVIAFTVRDTGIGIPPDKQQIIFEAFQQADGSTSRKYGGTGLGLAISRELSRLLGGEIRLTSSPGQGSAFTLYLPERYAPRMARKGASEAAAVANAAIQAARRARVPASAEIPEPPIVDANEANDDRESIQAGDPVLLIVENDRAFASVLLEAAREHGFKGVVTSLGAAALSLAREHPPSAITLDIFLSDIQGWRVLDRLKSDIDTRHIPVCVISTEDSRDQAIQSGALHFVAKPLQSKDTVDRLLDSIKAYASRDVKNLLVVQPDAKKLQNVVGYLKQAGDVKVTGARDARDALRALRSGDIDCLVLDPGVPGLSPEALMEEARGRPSAPPVPIIVHSEAGRGVHDEATWQQLSRAGPVCWVDSLDRLLDQTTVYLHRDASRLPEAQRGAIEGIHLSNRWIAGRKVLIVDDDMRNIFALSSVLEDYEMKILAADNGRDAIEILQTEPDIDVVLMDIMMPEMDGLETMREIRKLAHCRDLPIIAVTAKAMKGDRQRCLEAGAWDYLSKPVETQQLLATLRAWLKP